jgi:uncharacterized membrane protein YbhN (UPF0104 family)
LSHDPVKRVVVSERPAFTVEYLEPAEIEAEQLPDEFSSRRLRRSLLVLGAIVVVVVSVIGLVPGLGSLRERFAGAEWGWLAAAVAFQLGSCLSYVLVFRAVFCRRMSWRTSTEIAFSELAANSLLSVGGAGGLALGAWILRRGGLEPAHIARTTVAFFLITSLANVGFLILAGLGLTIGILPGAPSTALAMLPALGGLLLVGVAIGARPIAHALARRSERPKLERALESVGDGVGEAVRLLRSGDPMVLLGSAGYMLFDVAVLGVCFAAFGNAVPPAGVLLLAYIIGQLGSLIPLPGGIGGVDGGLIGTLVLYGADVGAATVAVLAYRAILLTVPAVIGLPALASLRGRLRDEAHDIAACAPGGQVEVFGRGVVTKTA